MPPKGHRHGKTSFQNKWLTDPELSPWLLRVENNIYSAKCRFCPSAAISLSAMGRQALTSHMKGQKHMKAARASISSVPLFVHQQQSTTVVHNSKSTTVVPSTINFSNPQPGPSTAVSDTNIPGLLPTRSQSSLVQSSALCDPGESTSHPTVLPPMGDRGIKKYLIANQVTKAEIIWAINCVMTHSSFKSAAAGVEVMKLMFPDSTIAEKLELQRTKMAYSIVFGVAPYYQNNLMNMLKDCSCFVLLFDESLNKISNKQQMDVCVRFWSEEKEETSTRYLTSSFLHSGKAIDLQQALLSSIKSLEVEHLLQVSMDGPNVNVKLMRDLKAFLNEQGVEKKIIDFGSCGLHTIHNAFKAAISATGWTVVTFLRASYNHFKYSPTRRGEFIRLTKCEKFPKKFCAIRWVENVDVAQTALDILPQLKLYTDTVKKTTKDPTPSFQTIIDSLNDPLLGPKIAFFKTLASEAEPFLREFQTDWPYIPFLYHGLATMVLSVLKRFVKPEKVRIGVDLEKEDNVLPYKRVDLGFSMKNEISKSKAKDVEIALLHKQAYHGMKAFVGKVESRSPLKFKITKYLTSLDPKVAAKPEGEQLFDKLVEEYVNSNWISGTKADKISRQFKEMIKTDEFAQAAKDFKRTKTRVDHFWIKELKNANGDNEEFKDFLKLTLILSHSNAHVERSFSINKECLVENLKEHSLIGIRTVYDGVQAEGGVKNVQITSSMVHAVKNSNAKYKEYLKQAKLIQSDEKKVQEEMKRKRKLLQELKAKKAKLMEEAQKESECLERQIEDLSKKL